MLCLLTDAIPNECHITSNGTVIMNDEFGRKESNSRGLFKAKFRPYAEGNEKTSKVFCHGGRSSVSYIKFGTFKNKDTKTFNSVLCALYKCLMKQKMSNDAVCGCRRKYYCAVSPPQNKLPVSRHATQIFVSVY